MNLARTFATAGRVLSQIRHDPRTVGLLLVVPSLLIGLVAWMFTDTDVFASIGPAMLALFPFIVMFLVTSIATLRERRSGTLERLFSMPLGKGDFILGYALAFGLLAIFQTAIAVSFAVWVCGLEIEGSHLAALRRRHLRRPARHRPRPARERVRPHRVPGRAVHAGVRLPAGAPRRHLPADRPAARPGSRRSASGCR